MQLLVLIVLIVGGIYYFEEKLLKEKLNFTSEDTDMMWFGLCSITALGAAATLIVALIFGGAIMASLINLLVSGGFGYYFFKKLQ